MKNLDVINRQFFLPKLRVDRGEKWFEYHIFDLEENEILYEFDFKQPVSSLYDIIKEEKDSKINEIIKSKRDLIEYLEEGEIIDNVIPINRINRDTFVYEVDNFNSSEISLEKKPPKVFNGFYFPDFLPNLMNRIRAKRNIFIAGESGTGKSDMIQKLADFYGQTLIRINFHQGVTESSLIGKYVVKNSETVFAYGLVPLAMKKGFWLLLDEIDYAEPEHTSVLQAILEGKSLVLTSNEGEILEPNPSFRIFATGNTTGRGDSTDSYHGTNFMNSAFLDRWTIFKMDYSKRESKIINSIINDLELSKKIIRIFELFRGLKKNGDINNAVFSTRRMMNIAEALKMGDSLKDAFHFELFTRFTDDENMILTECIRDILEPSYYLEKEWYLGNPHHEPQTVIQDKIKSNNSRTSFNE
jgi:MoxR-like ATPase